MTVFRIFPNSAHRSRLLYRFSSPSRFISSFSARSAGFSGRLPSFCIGTKPLPTAASSTGRGFRSTASAQCFSICCWAAGEKNPPGRRLFPQCRHRHRSGTPDRMVSGCLLESALLGLQRLSFSFSWLYLPVRGGRFRHRGRALDLCAGGAAHQTLETSLPQSAPWIKHPASAALCRRLRGCAHFSKPRSRHYLPLR